MTVRRRSRALNPDDEQRARAYAVRLISIRAYSERELRDRLALKGFSRQVEEAVAAYAKKSGLIDDALFARLWVASRIKRPLGVRRLRWELRRKGIAPSLIEEALSVATQEALSEEEVVRRLVKERVCRLKGVGREKMKARLFALLTRRGFSREIIFDVLRQELPEDEASDDT